MTLVPDLPPEGVRTRSEVLRAVTQLIGEQGIDGMTMRQVARSTGMSTGTISMNIGMGMGIIIIDVLGAQCSVVQEKG